MPSRIIKESICTSEDIAMLSPVAEILFYRLLVKADDYGTYYGNESIIRNTCFPLVSEKKVNAAKVNACLGELEKAGLIVRYIAEDGRKYLKLTKWDKHQRIRSKQSKFPQFTDACRHLTADCGQMTADCGQVLSNVAVIQSNPIQSESESNTFKPPTLEEVQAYCKERGNNVDAAKFHAFYSEGHWKDSKGNPVRNWKQKVITWERKDEKPSKVTTAVNYKPPAAQSISDLRKAVENI